MNIRNRNTAACGVAVLSLVLLANGCSGRDRATAQHPETFEAAKAVAAKRSVPILVDFYSPT